MANGLQQFQNDTPRDPNAPAKHFISKGEHRFDRIAYAGIGYVANVALSLGAVYWAERTHSGRSSMEWLLNQAKKIPGIPEKTAKYIAGKSLFLTGGFAVLAPIKLLEDRKVELVKKWDREYYGDDVDTNPELIERHHELETAPRQSWSSILGSRMLALVPFYATVGLIWNNQSKLAQITNSEFRGLDEAGKQARLAMAETAPEEFAQKMNKGFFFDRPIAYVSRVIGKASARMTGDHEALAKIGEMEKAYPGMLKEHPTKELRDPNHSALPYYFISEAITSAIVARAVYLLTRVLGPIWGREAKPAPVQTPTPIEPVQPDVADTPKVKNLPGTQIAAATIEHHATATAPQLEAARL